MLALFGGTGRFCQDASSYDWTDENLSSPLSAVHVSGSSFVVYYMYARFERGWGGSFENSNKFATCHGSCHEPHGQCAMDHGLYEVYLASRIVLMNVHATHRALSQEGY